MTGRGVVWRTLLARTRTGVRVLVALPRDIVLVRDVGAKDLHTEGWRIHRCKEPRHAFCPVSAVCPHLPVEARVLDLDAAGEVPRQALRHARRAAQRERVRLAALVGRRWMGIRTP